MMMMNWPSNETIASNFVVLAVAVVLKVQMVICWL